MTEEAAPGTMVEAVSAQVRTFLIADVRGYTRFTVEHGDEAAAKLASKFATFTRETVDALGGEVIELRGDEALAVFSSARQALKAAVELQNRFKLEASRDSTMELQVGMGLDTGEAVAVEGGFRGAALNLAARLCSLAAAGEVLSSEALIHVARKIEGLEYSERGLVELKGFADPIRIMQVQAVQSSAETEFAEANDSMADAILPIGSFLGALPEGLLVARDKELAKILAAVDAVAQGTGRLVLLSGEPGVGKTRLAQEVTLAARNRGFMVATGRCYESHQAMPFYPFVEVLTSLYKSAPSSIQSKIKDQWSVVGRLLPNQGVEAPSTLSEGEEDQQRLFWAITGFLQEMASGKPIAILLDDIHWADNSSLELLEHLTRYTRGNRILLLGSYRDVEVGRQHPLEAALLDLTRERLIEDISVRRLPQEGTAALVAASMGAESVSQEFAALLHERTEGNAFFVEEVLRELVERGDLYRENGRWERRQIEEIEVPKSVRAVVGQRLSRLSSEYQEILQHASVLGQTFEFDDLKATGDRSEEEVEACLEQAMGAGLIREAGGDQYAFNHALTQQSLYGELPLRRKRRIHLAAGEALERLPDKQKEKRIPELAWHFLSADDSERALSYALKAGDVAEEVFAHGDAERHYQTALELARELGDKGREAEALEKLGNVLGVRAQYEESLDALKQAAEHYRKAGDVDGECRVAESVGLWERGRGTAEHGIAYVQEVLDRLEMQAASDKLAKLYAILEWLFHAVGKYAEGLAAAEMASRLASEAGDDAVQAAAETARGTALQMLGRVDEGLPILEEAIRLAEVSRARPQILRRALANAGVGRMMRGELEQAQTYLQRVLELAEAWGNPWGIGFALINLVEIKCLLGEWEEGGLIATRALELSQKTTAEWWSPYARLAVGQHNYLVGNWDQAADDLDHVIDISNRSGDLQALFEASRWRTELDLARGKPGLALDRLNPLLENQNAEFLLIGQMMALVARAHVECGRFNKASVILGDAVELVRKRNLCLPLAELLTVQGVLSCRETRWEDGDKAFEEALALVRSMPYPRQEATTLYECGQMNLLQGATQLGQQQLEESLAIFQRLGAKKDIERTEQALIGITVTKT